MTGPKNAAIAGAGIAGLAAAIALARKGFDVGVFERAEQIKEIGAGLQVGPNAAAALEAIGAWQAVAPVTHAPHAVVIRDGQTGRRLASMPLGDDFATRFGKPYRVALRADLLGALLEVARSMVNIEIHTGAVVTGVTKRGQTALTFTRRDAVPADIAIGADGIRSALRHQLEPGRLISSAGHTIFRALIPLDQAPAAVDTENVILWLYPRGHVVQYVLPGARLNVVAAHQTAANLSGWNTVADGQEVTDCFSRACTELADLLAVVAEWRKWAGRDLQPSETGLSGNVTLIGDAAHATLPYLAQGAAMALEDAAILPRFVTRETADVAQALRAFEDHRRDRTNRIITQSRRSGETYHLGGLKAKARNLVLQGLPPSAFHSRLSWIYNWP